MDKIKDQAGKVSELVFAAETGATYKKTLTLTWDILRETGVLLWLAICFVFVGGEWFWKRSIALGRAARNWYENLQTPSPEESKSAGEMGQSALAALSTGTETLLYQAKKQLGMDAEPPAPKSPPSTATTATPNPPSVPTASTPSVEQSKPTNTNSPTTSTNSAASADKTTAEENDA